MNAHDCYVLFFGNTDAMVLFEALQARGVPARVSPTPRAARSSCGVSLLIPCTMRAQVEKAADVENIDLEGIVELPRQIDPFRDTYC